MTTKLNGTPGQILRLHEESSRSGLPLEEYIVHRLLGEPANSATVSLPANPAPGSLGELFAQWRKMGTHFAQPSAGLSM